MTTGFLDKERIVAGPGFNRWLVPPAALAIHLCIGMAYGFSVFWLPLSKALGIKDAAEVRPRGGLLRPSCSPPPATGRSPRWAGCTHCSSSSWAARRRCGAAGWSGPGPRKAGVVAPCAGAAACCVSALGVHLHQFWLMLTGLGRDRRHRPGAGLHLAGVYADQVVPGPARHGHRHGHHGLWRRRHDRLAAGGRADEALCQRHRRRRDAPTFVVMAAVYFVFMMAGALWLPRAGHRLEAQAGWVPPAPASSQCR